MSSEKNYLNDSYKSFFEDSLSVKDPEIYKAIQDEISNNSLPTKKSMLKQISDIIGV